MRQGGRPPDPGATRHLVLGQTGCCQKQSQFLLRAAGEGAQEGERHPCAQGKEAMRRHDRELEASSSFAEGLLHAPPGPRGIWRIRWCDTRPGAGGAYLEREFSVAKTAHSTPRIPWLRRGPHARALQQPGSATQPTARGSRGLRHSL